MRHNLDIEVLSRRRRFEEQAASERAWHERRMALPGRRGWRVRAGLALIRAGQIVSPGRGLDHGDEELHGVPDILVPTGGK